MNATRLSLRGFLPTCLLAVLATGGSLAAQGKFVTVGPVGMQPDIQLAINWVNTQANAIDWVVLVDPNAIQPYSPFLIDGMTAHTGRISVVSSLPGLRYMVQGGSGQVTIRDVPGGQTTVADLQTTYDNGMAPAISATRCFGMLRLRNIDIEMRTNVPAAAARGVIELDLSLNNMLWDIRLWREFALHGYTASAMAGNDGLSALFVRLGRVQAHQVFLQGYNNIAGPLGYGGDAVRVLDGFYLWLTTFMTSTTLQGGNGYNFGGSCVHSLPNALTFLESCGPPGVFYMPGTGPLSNGGAYTINNVLPSNMIPPACVFEHWGHVDAPTTMSVMSGVTPNLTLASNFVRSFVLYLDLTPFVSLAPPGFAGLLFLNPASVVIIGSGLLTPPQLFPILLPANPSLIGAQVVFQAALAPAGTSAAWVLSAPTETTLVP